MQDFNSLYNLRVGSNLRRCILEPERRQITDILADIFRLSAATPDIRREAIRLGAELMKEWDRSATDSDPSAGLSPGDARKAASVIGRATRTLPNPDLAEQIPLSNKDALETWLLQKLVNLLFAPNSWGNYDLSAERWYFYETAPSYLE